MDSRFSHAAWAQSLGGITYPLLADFWPHGRVSQAYGAWLPAEGISDRATVLVRANGTVAYAKSVGKDGRRDMDALLVDSAQALGRTLAPPASAGDSAPAATPPARDELFILPGCGACAQVMAVVRELRCDSALEVNTVGFREGTPEYANLLRIHQLAPGRSGTPLLHTVDGTVLLGTGAIEQYLRERHGKRPLAA